MTYEMSCPFCEAEFLVDAEANDGGDIYCPMCGANTDEQDEDEHDGQPDEAQEWHDFDPDC